MMELFYSTGKTEYGIEQDGSMIRIGLPVMEDAARFNFLGIVPSDRVERFRSILGSGSVQFRGFYDYYQGKKLDLAEVPFDDIKRCLDGKLEDCVTVFEKARVKKYHNNLALVFIDEDKKEAFVSALIESYKE